MPVEGPGTPSFGVSTTNRDCVLAGRAWGLRWDYGTPFGGSFDAVLAILSATHDFRASHLVDAEAGRPDAMSSSTNHAGRRGAGRTGLSILCLSA